MAKFSLFGRRTTASLAAADSVVVIGLGRFGSALAQELMLSGTEVLGIDADEAVVQAHNGLLTHVVRADSTQDEVLRQLSVPEFSCAVVAIGGDIQANILTASLLLKLGIPKIWAKAVSDPHGEILTQIGVQHVIYPEKDMGKRVAHLVRGSMQDYIEIGENFALVKTTPPSVVIGRPLAETKVRAIYGVTVTAFHRPDVGWSYTNVDTVLLEGDVILVAGQSQKVEAFSLLR